MAPDAPGAQADAHIHAWAAMRFELRDGHPWVVETCVTCGSERRYRAFERSWDGLPTRR
jgi:hypothetical protein